MKLLKTAHNLLPHHGTLYYLEGVFTSSECSSLFNTLIKETPWRQEPIKLFGRKVMQPRLTAWYASEGVSYSYSGLTMQGLAWTSSLLQIKGRVEEKLGEKFNSVLLNLYRDGNDSMGWHRDNEKELGLQPLIASVSFGAPRKFQLRTYLQKKERIDVEPAAGSIIVMAGDCQDYWEHSVPKTKMQVMPRINLTFRSILN